MSDIYFPTTDSFFWKTLTSTNTSAPLYFFGKNYIINLSTKMSRGNGYDQRRVQYEAVPLTAVVMHDRSRHQDLPFDGPGIASQPPAVIPHPIQRTPIQYPPYKLGYRQGDAAVLVPSILANPPLVQDQYMHMSWHTYHMFDASDLPALLFRIEPIRCPYRDVTVPVLLDAGTGLPVVNHAGKQLQYFSFLPRYIANDVSGALLEFWFRLDSRLEMNDVRDRMLPDSTNSVPKLNALSMKRTRWRDNCSMLAWRDCRTWPVRGDLIRVGRLSMPQVCFNTTMIVDWANQQFLKPVYDDIACRPSNIIGYVDAGLSLDFFAQGVVTTIPTRRMYAILTLRWRLQELAVAAGRGNNANDYLTLDNADEPIWWNDRMSGGNQNDERLYSNVYSEPQDNCTHSQYMQIEIGGNMLIGSTRRQRTRRRR